MKISKVFASLVVCGALIFPGALSSSAKEIDSDLTESINYSAPKPFIEGTRQTDFYEGFSKYITIVIDEPITQKPLRYSGTVYYKANESCCGKYIYKGTLFLQN